MKKQNKVLFLLFNVRVGIKGRTIPQFLIYAQNIINNLKGNPRYPDVFPTVADMEVNFEKLVTAQEEAIKGSVLDTMKRDEAYRILSDNINQVAAYIEWKTNGDPVSIAEVGFDVRKPSAPIGPLDAPQDFKALSTTSGIVKLSCDTVRGAKVYQFEMTDDINNPNWKVVAQGSRRAKLYNQPSGKQLWFRCVAIGTAGSSPYSNVVARYVS